MKTPRWPSHARGVLQLQAALALVVFLAAATLPYAWLVEHFGYDDILREPAAVILAQVDRGGPALAAAWLGFALASLLFIAVVLTLRRLLAAHGVTDRGTGTLGIASALAQAMGLMRWVLVVPALAAAFADPATSPAARDATLVVFDAVHRYGGMVIGEFIGQLLLAAWTAGMVSQLWRSRAVPRWLAAAGAVTLPLWLLGQSEVLQPVLPQLPLLEMVPLAFMGWELWLASLAMALLIRCRRDSREHGSSMQAPAPAFKTSSEAT